LLLFYIIKLLQEQQKQLSLLEEEQLKSSMVSTTFDKPQGQEVEVQTNPANDEEDAKTSKAILTKSQSLDRCDEFQEDGDKSGHSIRRSKTLPPRLKTSPLEQPEDKAGTGIFKQNLIVISVLCSCCMVYSGCVYVIINFHILFCCR